MPTIVLFAHLIALLVLLNFCIVIYQAVAAKLLCEDSR